VGGWVGGGFCSSGGLSKQSPPPEQRSRPRPPTQPPNQTNQNRCHAPHQADFSFFFDTGGRRRCYLAPERFFEAPAAAIDASAPLTPEMVGGCIY